MQSGDPIYLNDIDIVVKPSSGFADSYSKLTWDVTLISRTVNLSVGDTVKVADAPIQGTSMIGSTYANTSSYYGFNNAGSIGKSFTLLMIKDGMTFATTEVRITA
ncbi:MAG: hypothetical protein PHQ11_13010 [Paludibacter sp.]|nr:hypothetical protein [Paludibacter sp.]